MANVNAKVHKSQDPDKITVESGGEIRINAGGTITDDGTQASAIADHATPASATNEEIATKQNSILAALRGVGIIANS